MSLQFLGRRVWLWVAILIPTLIMLPLLLWPHYGLFSDAGQAITFPREVLANFPQSVSLLKPLDDGRWNPLFHGLTILIYAISPDSPRALYIFQWLMFVSTTASLSWIIFTLSRSSKSAILSVVLFCFGSAVFENFFTLDKVEPRLVFFFALILVGMTRQLVDQNKAIRWLSYVLIQSALGIFLVFSKESGVYVAASLVGTFVACLLNPGWGSRPRLVIGITAAVHSSVALLFVILFKILSSELSYRYVKYDITTTLILNNLRYYILTSPELVIGLLFSFYWCFACLLRQLPGPSGSLRIILVFTSISEITYLVGLSVWRWPLDYYMLPGQFSACLIIGLSLYAFKSRLNKKIVVSQILFVASCFLWVAYVSTRIWSAVAIYEQDAVKDRLAELLSDSRWRSSRVILPLGHPDNAEIGERLEFFINLKRPKSEEVDLFNFWEPPVLNRENLQRFSGSAGVAPGSSQLKYVASHPDRYVIWRFGSSSNAEMELLKDRQSSQKDGIFRSPEDVWRASYLHQGDLILVPVGNPSLVAQRARGMALYQRPIQDFLRVTPLHLTRVGGVTSHTWGPSIGWDLLRVEQLESEDSKNTLQLPALLSINIHPDITPSESSEILVNDHKIPDQGLLLGLGWYDLEVQKFEGFRWTGSRSQLMMTKLKPGKCTLDIDIEPAMQKDSLPFSLKLNSSKSESTYLLQGRKVLHFEFFADGDLVQTIQLTTTGGLVLPPPGDPRPLKARVFSLRLSGPCNGLSANKY